VGATTWTGCRGHQQAQVLKDNQADMVGSHAAGAETFKPLIDESVAKLLGRQQGLIQQASHGPYAPHPKRICFIGVENKSAEEIGDFKEQIYQQIDSRIVGSGVFAPIHRRFVEAALRDTRLRPDQLFIPANMRVFAAVLEQQGQPVDYLLYATITSGTTRSNKDYQRDYLLTLEMINVNTGHYDKESAELRKGYQVSQVAKAKSFFNPFK
jgi:hypothetical protein